MNNYRSGKWAEFLARLYLRLHGYRIVARNIIVGRGTTAGEIDIIASKDNYLVFIEVKYRSSTRYGAAVEAVNYKKQQTIRKVASYYLATRYRSCDIPCRFDVLGIDGRTITHIKNAF